MRAPLQTLLRSVLRTVKASPAQILAIAICILSAAHAMAAEERIIDSDPYDEVVLTQAGSGKSLKVLTLKLPQRPLETKPTEGSLAVHLLERPDEDYEVAWGSVARIRVFEQILLEEAQRLSAAGDFDAAYDYYGRLLAEYPSYPKLNDAINDYLQQNALALYKSSERDRALALLMSLAKRNPQSPGLDKAVETVAGEIIQQHLKQQDFAAARRVLDVWQTQFQGVGAAGAAAWQQRFETAAGKQVADAQRLIAQKQYVAARKAAGRALGIWPNLDSAAQVLAQIQREFPFVTVAVLETSPRRPKWRIDDWAALRTSRLVERTLAEEVNFGAEGGVYRSPFGEYSMPDTGLQLTLKLTPPKSATPAAERLSADNLARYLLAMADPHDPLYRSNFASIFSRVSVTPAGGVQIDWSRRHVRPESLLQVPPPSLSSDASAPATAFNTGLRFAMADFTPPQVVFVAIKTPGQDQPERLQAVVELTMPSDDAAVASLIGGEVDVLDRVPPWQVEKVRSVATLQVGNYRLPTVHVLIPNSRNPLLANREFRRALCFGIDRTAIVKRVILGGVILPGFEVISGPFPAGTSLSDPIRYAYNSQIAPRPYEPRLASILATVAWSSVLKAKEKEAAKAAEKQGSESEGKPTDAPEEKPGEISKEEEAPTPELPELVLAHPNDPLVRVACQSIQLQLSRAGIPIKLVEASADDLLAGNVECDLRYAELAVWEPVTDAHLLFGPGGIAADAGSPYLNAALRRLDAATSWNDVRARLAELHEIAYHDLPVIPLWQTVNYFAHRKSVRGVGESPLTLYQDIDQWTVTPGENVAQLRKPSNTPTP
jgi:tetratricopeptide (TPR) repeat protein